MARTARYKFTCDNDDGVVVYTTAAVLPAGWVAVTPQSAGGTVYRFHQASEASGWLSGVFGGLWPTGHPVEVDYQFQCDYAAGHAGTPPVVTNATGDLPEGWQTLRMPDGTTKVFDSAAHASAALG